MTLDLYREPSSEVSTSGRLAIAGVFECWTLEDIVRDGPKVAHETAIPAGRYQVVITRSQRFECMLPLLLDVPGFEGIRIHAGNTDKDTSGCLLVGQSRGAHDSILSSRLALAALQPKIAGAIARGERVHIVVHPAAQKGSFSA